MSPQKEILTGLMSLVSSKGYIDINPFYHCSEEFIDRHKDKAKELYPFLFRQFIASWYKTYKKGDPIPPPEWEGYPI